MIRLDDIRFGYLPGESVFDGFSMTFDAGLNLVVGPNGCGKSTLLKIAVGVEHPGAGRVLIDGHDLWRDEVAARSQLAYLPERPDLSPYATVREILVMVSRLRGLGADHVDAALDWSGVHHLGTRTVHELSKGERRRAVLAACRLGDPRNLVFDEPLDAMDRAFRSRLVEWLGDRAANGATVVLVSHEIESFTPIATRVLSLASDQPRLVSDLPADPQRRLSTVDRLATGGEV